MEQRHLLGVWHADLPGQGGATVLHLGPHPQLSGSVRGTLERAGRTAQVTGDVHEGVLTLEESTDGRRISATWLGDVVPGRCGQEISGVWSTPGPNSGTDTSTDTSTDNDNDNDIRIPFVLRQQSISFTSTRP